MTDVKQQSFDFEQIKRIQPSIKYSVYGFIRREQILLPSNNPYFTIPELVHFMIIFYYYDPECFAINDSKIFNYENKEFESGYVTFGKLKVERKLMKEFKWIIEIDEHYQGVFGIFDDTNNESNNFTKKSPLQYNVNCMCVGADNGGWGGYKFNVRDEELSAFAMTEDIITIHLNYATDTVSFHSKYKNQTIHRKLKDGVESIKFVAQFYYKDSEMKMHG
eukprot:40559_1